MDIKYFKADLNTCKDNQEDTFLVFVQLVCSSRHLFYTIDNADVERILKCCLPSIKQRRLINSTVLFVPQFNRKDFVSIFLWSNPEGVEVSFGSVLYLEFKK